MAVNRATTTWKLISLPWDLVQAISDFRYSRRIPTESEAIRCLIGRGLQTTAADLLTQAIDAKDDVLADSISRLVNVVAGQPINATADRASHIDSN